MATQWQAFLDDLRGNADLVLGNCGQIFVRFSDWSVFTPGNGDEVEGDGAFLCGRPYIKAGRAFVFASKKLPEGMADQIIEAMSGSDTPFTSWTLGGEWEETLHLYGVEGMTELDVYGLRPGAVIAFGNKPGSDDPLCPYVNGIDRTGKTVNRYFEEPTPAEAK